MIFGQPIDFEWRYFDNDERWSALSRVSAQLNANLRRDHAMRRMSGDLRLGLYALCGLILFFTAAIMTTGASDLPEERRQIGVASNLYTTLALEEEARRNNDESQLARLIDPQIGQRWQRAWTALGAAQSTDGERYGVRIVELRGIDSLMQAEVVFDRPLPTGWWQLGPYRETRFYRQGPNGWLRTLPPAAFWGQERVLETNHLRFEFRERDAATIMAIANRIEESYLSLREVLALDEFEAIESAISRSASAISATRNIVNPATDSAAPVEKITIRLTLEQVSGRGSYGNRLEVTAPLMLPSPADVTAVDFLTHTVISRLTTLAVDRLGTPNDDFIANASFAYSWRNMRRGVRSWLRTELIGVPYYWDAQANAILRSQRIAQLPLSLTEITDVNADRLADRDYLMWQSAAAASVVQYAVKTYGREAIPPLMEGFRHAHSWQELLDDTFDATYADFEADWNRFLQEQLESTTDYTDFTD
ncbi:MAG: hypothetical protein R2911_29910 [Caldilineaceae bacterium]